MYYDQLKTEYGPQFAKMELDFDKSYEHVMKEAKDQGNEDVILNVARRLLSEILAEYARSKANTRLGKVGRFFSSIIGFIVENVSVKTIFGIFKNKKS